MDELLTLVPELQNNNAFIAAYIQRLQPGNDQVNWRTVPALYGAYLDRLHAFTEKLSPAQNSLRAHAMFHRLQFTMSQGNYVRTDFEKYLQLPRRMDYLPEEFLRRGRNSEAEADLSRDFASSTGLPQINGDETLVRAYLQHFFAAGTSVDAFKAYIREDYLRRLYAETMLLQGKGNLEQWYSWLEPNAVEDLKSRVDVAFVPENKQDFALDEPVKLGLWIKNVDRLLVRVFAIDVKNYYQQFGNREVNTDIDLDGLVASHEDVHNYGDAPARRVRSNVPLSFLALRVVVCG